MRAPHELPICNHDGPPSSGQDLEQSRNQQDSRGVTAVALMGQHQPDEWDHCAPEEGAQHEDVQRGLARVLGRAVHDQGEPAVGQQGKQDVRDVLRSELSVVEDPGDRLGLGF